MCVAQIFLDSYSNQSGKWPQWRRGVGSASSVAFKSVVRSHLPSFLLPCPQCGHRMAVTAVTPARSGGGAESSNLKDITHGCMQCGTTLTRTVRRRDGDDRETAIGA